MSDGDTNKVDVRPAATATDGLPSAHESGFTAAVAADTRAAVGTGYIPADAPMGGDGAPDCCGQCSAVLIQDALSDLGLTPHYKCKCGKCAEALCATEDNLRGEDNQVWCSMTCKLSRN